MTKKEINDAIHLKRGQLDWNRITDVQIAFIVVNLFTVGAYETKREDCFNFECVD